MFNLKHRPDDFENFIGNSHIVRGLLASYPEWPTTFLITGPSGIGKTTLGRLIASQLECTAMNIKEIDAGADRGIDNIRQIINGAYSRPLIGKGKCYIFDECQGLTKDAQQALLKITEEAPKDTYFIFCSTDPQKIIKALQTRCQYGRINLTPLSVKELGIILKNICDKENIELKGIVRDIAKACLFEADGIPRNAVMLFEKYYKYNNVDDVLKEMKNTGEFVPESIWDMVNTLDKGEFSEFLKLFEKQSRGNYEAFRITMGNMFKKKLLKATINKSESEVKKYVLIMQMFKDPVDNNLGDIELIYRFGDYYTWTQVGK